MKEISKSRRLILIFSILSALFILSQFYRVSSAVIAPNLIQELGLNAEMLGFLGGAFFYAFTLLQIPMGPMLDRIGPRMIMSDRKSTRLNSSHGYISYAVFCLRKSIN